MQIDAIRDLATNIGELQQIRKGETLVLAAKDIGEEFSQKISSS